MTQARAGTIDTGHSRHGTPDAAREPGRSTSGGNGQVRRDRAGQRDNGRTSRPQSSSAASHSQAAEQVGRNATSRHARQASAASHGANAHASASSHTSSTQNEPARQSFIVRPRVRVRIAVADGQDSRGAGGAGIGSRRRFPASGAADAGPSRRFPASYQLHIAVPMCTANRSRCRDGACFTGSKGRAIARRAPSGKVQARDRGMRGRVRERFLIHRRISVLRAAAHALRPTAGNRAAEACAIGVPHAQVCA